jgi:hypothetical protein
LNRPRIPSRRQARRRRAVALGLLALCLPLALVLAGVLPGPGATTAASGAAGAEEVGVQTDDSLPARDVTMFGSSPSESPGETWGIGETGTVNSGDFAILRYTAQTGWTLAGAPVDASSKPLREFQPDRTPLMGATTAQGDGVLLGKALQEKTPQKVLLLRSPGGVFTEVPVPSTGEGALLHPKEGIYAEGRTPLIAPLDEGSRAGVLLVPINEASGGSEERVLHYDGEHWSAEPIEVPASSAEEGGGFRVLAIGASSPGNAWLLAQLSSATRNVALFRRGEGHWAEVKPAPLTVEGQPFAIPGVGGGAPHTAAQLLTVTGQGVWIDGERSDVSTPLTMFFKPEGGGEASSGEVTGAWCDPGEGFPGCTELPQALPDGIWRSFAWANGSGETPYGERVMTGFGEGVSLRLEGSSFRRVLALGGSDAPNDVGGSFGAAFASARDGWLGNDELPVHLSTSLAPDRLAYYPVPFRHVLTAAAPQPGAPAGALSSEALAVGDEGEVARYHPGEGWEPETLFGPGERHETPGLRAVAWPTPNRAYAVGRPSAGALNQMWLWRGETGRWEQDPAQPLNFTGNLLGIAFDPANPSRGYAVGEQGVLLRYGKTWQQEPESSIPEAAQGASFTSVAFAGSEALVAFRKIHLETKTEPEHYTGGLLVNEGSGWHVDEAAGEALSGEIPWTVAGLPDGGAALAATVGGLESTARILERQSAGSPWQATTPYPGTTAPGSLAIFREGGAVRVVGSGGLPDTRQVEDQRQLGPGFPPNYVGPYPIATGYVIRQTAAGWSDEEHARDPAQDPLGEYKFFDLVYEPDPSSAVLISEDGSAGWAVGGVADPKSPVFDTADIARYPSESGSPPPGARPAPVEPNAEQAAQSANQATFAVGGGAQCVAPCADRARAGIGPDAWLATALRQAAGVPGVRAFMYTGPRVTTGVGHGGFPVPYSREFARYAEVLGSAGGTLPVYPAASPTDLVNSAECQFQAAFKGFAQPLGGGVPEAWISPLHEIEGEHPGGTCATYYAFSSTSPSGSGGGAVRMIVLDTSAEGEEWSAERGWLSAQLGAAKEKKEPAIVVGSADLNAEIAEGVQRGLEAADAIVEGHASAYLYDAPESNVQVPLHNSAVPAFGSGTLGYVSAVKARTQDFLGASGFLVLHVNVAERAADNVAPVSARLIPNIGELAMEAEQGTLLRRSQVASFAGLARRPRAGGRSQRGLNRNEANEYIPIPENCIGNLCAQRIAPEYTISSADPSIGKFVSRNTAVAEANAVLLGGPKQEPLPLGEEHQDLESGLFCAFNPGQTTVTISAGGLSASLTVTVQAGSVRRPCGTVPAKHVNSQTPVSAPPAPAPTPTPVASAAPASAPPPVPPPPVAVAAAPALAPKAPAPSFAPLAPPAVPLLAFVPPPVPTPARPTPPSGTSAVTSPVEIAEHEEESEEAPESVSNKAVAYHSSEHEPDPAFIIGIIVLAAFAGATARRRPRRGRRGVRLAQAGDPEWRARRRRRGRGPS